ncbi:ABC transporter ATP-binding protein [Candidatus Aerophobetes bacterium]|uniref:ABC transporter ATP-binding protein n=1 Tax=Aerophobetes bacterium TaxID=2030807 RepID=A0A523RP92_UNCAE|nr:MAG: ABC transporter ATP-binding protein [Candidatus Aerophobetes bacterium]
MNDKNILLKVKDLKKDYLRTKGALRKKVVGIVKAVDKINLFIREGETLGLVGESGCGKTTTGRCILRAIEPTSGEIIFKMNNNSEPINMASLDKDELKKIRKNMAMIFQDPYSSLNPRMTILEIVAEPFVIHKITTKRGELRERVSTLLKMARLDPAYMDRYPHAFSGGQRQRVAIARALALRPKFIVADEPVSALDVSMQAQVLNLLIELQQKLHLTYLFIAHNLAVVKYVSDRVAIMYVGKIVELASTEELFTNPKHPYTEALLSAVPKADPRYKKKKVLLAGDIADPANPPSGCYFHPRCRYAKEICKGKEPPLINNSGGGDEHAHYVACHFKDKLKLVGIERKLKLINKK